MAETDIRAQRDLQAWEQDLATRWNLPADFLSRDPVATAVCGGDRAVWSARGGTVACADASMRDRIAELLEPRVDCGEPVALAGLLDILARELPLLRCRIDVSLYCSGAPKAANRSSIYEVEMLSREASGLDDIPDAVEHVSAIRDRDRVWSWASNIPALQVGDHWLHSVGVGTHPDQRRKGLATAVTAALMEHIASEGGAAIWVCEARNVPSLSLALKLGFQWHFSVITWELL